MPRGSRVEVVPCADPTCADPLGCERTGCHKYIHSSAQTNEVEPTIVKLAYNRLDLLPQRQTGIIFSGMTNHQTFVLPAGLKRMPVVPSTAQWICAKPVHLFLSEALHPGIRIPLRQATHDVRGMIGSKEYTRYVSARSARTTDHTTQTQT